MTVATLNKKRGKLHRSLEPLRSWGCVFSKFLILGPSATPPKGQSVSFQKPLCCNDSTAAQGPRSLPGTLAPSPPGANAGVTVAEVCGVHARLSVAIGWIMVLRLRGTQRWQPLLPPTTPTRLLYQHIQHIMVVSVLPGRGSGAGREHATVRASPADAPHLSGSFRIPDWWLPPSPPSLHLPVWPETSPTQGPQSAQRQLPAQWQPWPRWKPPDSLRGWPTLSHNEASQGEGSTQTQHTTQTWPACSERSWFPEEKLRPFPAGCLAQRLLWLKRKAMMCRVP